ncbi:MAG: glycosyltransferase [Planctomycetes bacterium]|nr:glycosyltransferase [Planctomycetota bacterium]
MRVFYLITDLDIGGAEKTLCHLVRGLPRAEFHPVVACLTGAGELGGALADEDVSVCYVRMRSRFDLGATLRVARLLSDHQPDVLHTFLFHANLIGRMAAWLAGVPVVISSARVAEPRRHHLWLDGWTHRLVDAETCVSDSVRNYLAKRRVMPVRKLVTVPNGVDVDRFDVNSRNVRQDLGIDEDAAIVLAIARLERQKGLSYLLRAAEGVIEKRRDALFLIAGEGGMRNSLERIAATRNLESRVRFLGFRRDVPRLISAADVFVVSSLWEGMPNALLEAMAGAKPVVATDVEGCREIVQPEQTGLLVPPRDARALAEGIVSLLENSETRKAMGRAGRKHVEEHFTLRQMIQNNVLLYVNHVRRAAGPASLDIWRHKRLA